MSRYFEGTRTLAMRLTVRSKILCSRGVSEAKGENVGLCISLPFEQGGNSYITRRLSFDFHYFFMRKFWFLYLAKAMVIMPGRFGTLDELM